MKWLAELVIKGKVLESVWVDGDTASAACDAALAEFTDYGYDGKFAAKVTRKKIRVTSQPDLESW